LYKNTSKKTRRHIKKVLIGIKINYLIRVSNRVKKINKYQQGDSGSQVEMFFNFNLG